MSWKENRSLRLEDELLAADGSLHEMERVLVDHWEFESEE